MAFEAALPIDSFTPFLLAPRRRERPLERDPVASGQRDSVSLGPDAMEPAVTTFWSQVMERPQGMSAEALLSVAARNLGLLTWDWLKKAFPDSEENPHKAVLALLALLRRSSPQSASHSDRVGQLASQLAHEIEMEHDDREALEQGLELREVGLAAVELATVDPQERDELARQIRSARISLTDIGSLHDIGKLYVPGGILSKPGPLTEAEMEIVRLHPVVGEALLRPIPGLEPILPAVRGHHERWDGRGYPDKLSGLAIPFSARILCLADCYDAMTGERPYRRPVSGPEALMEVLRGAGRQFDPELAGYFARLVARSLS